MQPRIKSVGRKEIKMKREDIKAIFAEATDEQLKKVMDLNGADVEKLKGKVTVLEAENTEKKSAFDKLKDEFEALKSSNAAAEDYKTKFETLKADIDQKEEAAKEARKKAEREADILNRYEAAAVDKDGNPLKWRHDAIKADYLKKFGEAVADKTNTGKSDADILHELIKDDANAVSVPQPVVKLKGANPVTGEISKENFAKMGYKDRVKLYNENPTLYNELTGGNE